MRTQIRAHNDKPGVSYFMGVNKFTDMTDAEKARFRVGRRHDILVMATHEPRAITHMSE